MTHHPSHDAPALRNATTLWDSPARKGDGAGLRFARIVDQQLRGRRPEAGRVAQEGDAVTKPD